METLRLHDIEKSAAEMGVSLNYAIGARRRYLWDRFDAFWYAKTDPLSWWVVCLPECVAILNDLYLLKRDLFFRSKPQPKGRELTPEMKDQAKAVPVTRLLDFDKHGRAVCWMHDDKRPSLYVAPRVNKVCCPVCSGPGGKQLMMDPIDIIMRRDGKNYADAVRYLCSGGY